MTGRAPVRGRATISPTPVRRSPIEESVFVRCGEESTRGLGASVLTIMSSPYADWNADSAVRAKMICSCSAETQNLLDNGQSVVCGELALRGYRTGRAFEFRAELAP